MGDQAVAMLTPERSEYNGMVAMKMFIRTLFLVSILVVPLLAVDGVKARIEDGWIIASSGVDESAQYVRVKVWGAVRIHGEFRQVDGDRQKEYVVISRNQGTGPYYRLQIIDFRPNAIRTYSYYSGGHPRVENGLVYLGRLPNGYQGAATFPVYSPHQLTLEGLRPVDEAP